MAPNSPQYNDFVRLRRRIIASSPELQERALINWLDDSTADFGTLMQRSLADLRQAAGATPSTGNERETGSARGPCSACGPGSAPG
ncbi:MAG: hypothetical protein ABSB76_03670 [Streptosporangiaceae bacterium]